MNDLILIPAAIPVPACSMCDDEGPCEHCPRVFVGPIDDVPPVRATGLFE